MFYSFSMSLNIFSVLILLNSIFCLSREIKSIKVNDNFSSLFPAKYIIGIFRNLFFFKVHWTHHIRIAYNWSQRSFNFVSESCRKIFLSSLLYLPTLQIFFSSLSAINIKAINQVSKLHRQFLSLLLCRTDLLPLTYGIRQLSIGLVIFFRKAYARMQVTTRAIPNITL